MRSCNVVDSSAWLEYLANTRRAAHFAAALEATDKLVVPVITIHEVFKKVLRERNEADALEAVSLMHAGTVVSLDETLALDAARYALPLADGIIYATATAFGATLWTQDEHFRDLPNVRFFPKP